MTLGIVGVGAIGSRLARIAHHGFGMRVSAASGASTRLPAEARPCALDVLVKESDFVVLACRSRPRRTTFQPR